VSRKGQSLSHIADIQFQPIAPVVGWKKAAASQAHI
jgi:hypothetical protein